MKSRWSLTCWTICFDVSSHLHTPDSVSWDHCCNQIVQRHRSDQGDKNILKANNVPRSTVGSWEIFCWQIGKGLLGPVCTAKLGNKARRALDHAPALTEFQLDSSHIIPFQSDWAWEDPPGEMGVTDQILVWNDLRNSMKKAWSFNCWRCFSKWLNPGSEYLFKWEISDFNF